VFITTVPSDNQVLIEWTPNVPWVNDTFVVYRQNDLTLLFDSVGFSTVNHFADTGLVNGKNYCYKVKSSGSYFSPGFINPIINYSQITCDAPIDRTPSCPPVLM